MKNYLRLSGVAGHTGELADRVRAALPASSAFDIGTKGQLLEWDSEYEEAEPHHRHTSHLYALHPARLITPESGRPSGANCPAEYRSAIDDQPETRQRLPHLAQPARRRRHRLGAGVEDQPLGAPHGRRPMRSNCSSVSCGWSTTAALTTPRAAAPTPTCSTRIRRSRSTATLAPAPA